MIEDSKLTKVVTENKNIFQCYYNNVGFCKFGDECRFQHFYQKCPKKICREIRCRNRHPKTCKHGRKCKFLKRNCCAYDHENDTNDSTRIETEKLEEEVKKLESEIVDLNKIVKEKETKLQEMSEMIMNQNKTISELRTENSILKSSLSEMHSKLKEQTKLIENKIEIINANNDEISRLRGDIKCDKCDFSTNNLMLLVKHKTHEHKLTR